MSIQDQPVRYDIPDKRSSSSLVPNRGNEEYDPFTSEDGESENEQLADTKHSQQESIRTNNGTTPRRIIILSKPAESSDKSSSMPTSEQHSRRRSKSPAEHHRKHSDRRSRSPHYRNHNSSDRKRPRASSPDTSISNTVNHNDSANSDLISSSKYRRTSRTDNRTDLKYPYRQRSPSNGTSSKFSSTSSNNNNHYNSRKPTSSRDDKPLDAFENYSTRRFSKRDDYHSYRDDPSRNYHSSSSSSSKYPARDHSSSSYQSYYDRRIVSSKVSDISRHHTESYHEQATAPNRKHSYRPSEKHYTSVSSNATYSRKRTSDVESASAKSSSRFQSAPRKVRQTDTSKPEAKRAHTSLHAKPDATEAPSVPSVPVKTESANTNGSSKSTNSLKTNGSTTDNMLMEEMLLDEEEEKKQSPVKSIDLDSVTIPDPSATKPEVEEAPVSTAGATTAAPTAAPTATPTTVETSSTVTPSTPAAAATTTTTTTPTTPLTPVAALTPSPTKKPYTLYKVPHTNHMTPPLPSRHKKPAQKEPSNTSSDASTVTNITAVLASNKPSAEESFLRTSLDERISTLLGAPPVLSNKASYPSVDQQLDTHTNPLQPTTTTPSDKSTESPQDVNLLITAAVNKVHEHSPLSKKLLPSEERRSTTSKHYTSEWLASQKPEEAPPEELAAPPSLIVLPTLISSQSSNTGTSETTMLSKLSEAMSKLIQKKTDTGAPATTDVPDEAVPTSAKHLERSERRKQREIRQGEIVAIAKEALKPAFKRHDITKEDYKTIMKKVVTKATNANEVDRIRISKMIEGYVKKYRTVHERSASQISTVANGNGS